MPNIQNTPVLLHGIGEGVLSTVSGKVLELTTSQNMKLDVTATTEDVYGGDGLFPLYTYISGKEGTVEIDSADFSIAQLNLAQETADITSGVKGLRHYHINKTASATAGVLSTGTHTGVAASYVIDPDGALVDIVSASPAANEIAIDATGQIDFGSGLAAGVYSIWVKEDVASAVESQMLKNAMPEVCSFDWSFKTVDQPGNQYQIDLYVPRCRADGQFTIESGRENATVPKLTIKILDPGNGRDDFATIKVIRLA